MSTEIKYKDRAIVTFEKGTVTLHTEGEQLESDLEITSTGGGGEANLIEKTITENGEYPASADGVDGYSKVTVNVPEDEANLIEKTITANDTYLASADGADGYSKVIVNVAGDDNALFNTLVDGSITEVTAEDLAGVTKLRVYAFAGSYLANITIPDHIIAIPGSCFPYTQLKNINIHDGITTIGSSAFSSCTKLEEVSIGSGVTKIDNAAFSGCTALKKLTCEAVTPPTLGTNVFNNVPSDCMIYVLEDSVLAYRRATNWAGRSRYIFAKGTTGIKFTVNGIAYTAEEGMTWSKYLGSLYNTTTYFIMDDYVFTQDLNSILSTDYDTGYVTKDQTITAGATYYLVTNPFAIQFNIDGLPQAYPAMEGMTWETWITLVGGYLYGGSIVGDYVSVMDETVVLSTTEGGTDYVTKDQTITAGATYYLVTNPFAIQFTVEGGSTYTIVGNKTFQQLIDDKFDGGLYYNDGGYVGCQWPEGILYKNGEKVPVTYQIQNGDVFTVA